MSESRSSPIAAWLAEFLPLVWVAGFALYEFTEIHRNIAMTWHWSEDAASAGDLDPMTLVATTALILLMAAPLLLLPRGWRYGVLLLLSVVCSVVVIVDTLHANYFSVLPSVAAEIEVRQLLSITRSISDLFSPLYVFFFLDSLAMLLLWPSYRRLSRQLAPWRPGRRRGAALVCLLVGLALTVPPALRLRGSQALASADKLRQFGATLGVLPYHAIDLAALALPRPALSEADYRAVKATLDAARAGREAAVSPLRGAARGANLILISAESVMGFLVGLKVGGELVMPRLTAFAEESLYYPNFHEQCWLGNTSDAEFLVLQSLYPLPLQPVATTAYDRAYFALPHLLAKAGYATVAASGEESWMWNMHRMHPALGFARGFYKPDYKQGEEIYNWITDKDFFEQSVDKLAGLPEPFMAYLVSSSNHHPFDIPAKYRTFKVGALEGSLLGNYLQAANYFDRAFGALIDRLKAKGLLESSVIAIYGDNRAYLRPDRDRLLALLGHPEGSLLHRLRARKLLLFAVRLPGGAHAGRRETYAGQIDVAPTLLSLLGLDSGAAPMLGRDLTAPGAPMVGFRDGSLADGRVYLINRPGQVGNAHCLDAVTGENVDCGPYAGERAALARQLDASDKVIELDLFDRLRRDSAR